MKHLKIFEDFDDNEDEDYHDINTIVNSYIETLIWTEEGKEEDDPFEGKSIFDISDASKEKIKKEVEWFIDSAGDVFEDLDDEQIGHDLWLTRNGHGTGFSDRIEEGYNLETIEELCDILGTAEAYVGDDGKIYHESNDRYKKINIEEYKKKKELEKSARNYNI